MNSAHESKYFQTIVVGGGQAGLAVGYHLKRRGFPFVILDANERVGDAWRKRWDSLRVFTPARYDGLPGMPFPAPADSFPGKDAVADYLESYASEFDLPVLTEVRVESLSRAGSRFVLTAADRRFEADNVVVAMAPYQAPRVPEFAKELAPDILQIDCGQYRNPAQLEDGGVLVVGAGTSGAEIALEVVRERPTSLSGRYPKVVPFRLDSAFGRHIGLRLMRFMAHHVLNTGTPIGRKARPKLLHAAGPLARVKPKHIANAGVQRVPRVVGVRDGLPLLEDERTLDVANVIWCTGFRPDFSWIHFPIFGKEEKEPVHHRGVIASEPGLYFVGLFFLHALSSSVLMGVGRDAEYAVEALVARSRAAPVAAPLPT
ncbi:MAG: flavin-containing monooxygenase [Chloroflexota bacterium]